MNYAILLYLKNGQTHSLDVPDDLKIREKETLADFQKRLYAYLVDKISKSGLISFNTGNGILAFNVESIDGFYVGEVQVSKEK